MSGSDVGYRRLVAAILLRAVGDARAGDGEALDWLRSDGAVQWADWLDMPLDVDRMMQREGTRSRRLSPVTVEILSAVRQHPTIPPAELARMLGLRTDQVYSVVRRLKIGVLSMAQADPLAAGCARPGELAGRP